MVVRRAQRQYPRLQILLAKLAPIFPTEVISLLHSVLPNLYCRIKRGVSLTLAVFLIVTPAIAGVTISSTNGIVMTGADGVTFDHTNGIVMTGADGIVMTGADGIVMTGADGIVMTGADGAISSVAPSGMRFDGVTGIVMTGADGIVMTGADSILMTDAYGVPIVEGSAGNSALSGLQSVDPELALQLNQLTDDSTINAVIVYHQMPTDADLASLQQIGIVGGTRYRALPMITITATRDQIVAISHLSTVRSIYGNRTLNLNAEPEVSAQTGVDRARRDVEITNHNGGLFFTGRG